MLFEVTFTDGTKEHHNFAYFNGDTIEELIFRYDRPFRMCAADGHYRTCYCFPCEGRWVAASIRDIAYVYDIYLPRYDDGFVIEYVTLMSSVAQNNLVGVTFEETFGKLDKEIILGHRVYYFPWVINAL